MHDDWLRYSLCHIGPTDDDANDESDAWTDNDADFYADTWAFIDADDFYADDDAYDDADVNANSWIDDALVGVRCCWKCLCRRTLYGCVD